MTDRTVWIVNPYGSLPGEPWSTYRSTMLAECLARNGYDVTQFISNFEHRSKTFRAAERRSAGHRRYAIEIVPSTGYDSHISIDRIRYERRFARNLVSRTAGAAPPQYVVLAEPAVFYYDILLRAIQRHPQTAVVLDLIDLWPELFKLALPAVVQPLSNVVLSPFYHWRKRLYRRADAVVAVSRDYLDVASRLVGPDVPLEVVYWSFDDRDDAGEGTTLSEAGRLLADLTARKRQGDVWAVYAGTLGESYDIPAIVELSRRLPAALRGQASLKFVVAGDGPLAEWCRTSRSEDFVFVGRLAAGELRELYAHGDIALSTYRGESTVSMPIKAFDYLRFGLPMVNSLGRDLGALVREHSVGINYDPRDPAALSSAVERLTLDPELRRAMGQNASRLALEFAPERQYGKFVKVLEAVASKRARQPFERTQ